MRKIQIFTKVTYSLYTYSPSIGGAHEPLFEAYDWLKVLKYKMGQIRMKNVEDFDERLNLDQWGGSCTFFSTLSLDFRKPSGYTPSLWGKCMDRSSSPSPLFDPYHILQPLIVTIPHLPFQPHSALIHAWLMKGPPAVQVTLPSRNMVYIRKYTQGWPGLPRALLI